MSTAVILYYKPLIHSSLVWLVSTSFALRKIYVVKTAANECVLIITFKTYAECSVRRKESAAISHLAH